MASESMPWGERFLIGGLAAVAALVAMAACDPEADASPADPVFTYTELTTVDGVDYPICVQEDCSDQPGQIGVWINSEGERWLSVGEYSLFIEPEINHGPPPVGGSQ